MTLPPFVGPAEQLDSLAAMPDRKNHTPPTPNYWTYDLGNGWTAMAGKTAVDNDLVTFQLARQTDHWFHLAGAPGSHVLLRGPAGETPTRELLQQAANIAAFHSKARNGGTCHVDCCLAKDVSKPPHVPAGTVTIAHARTIKARPELPPGHTA